MRSLLMLVLLGVVASSCRNTGDECDTCASEYDCKSGLSCASFSDGSKRCASGRGSTTCSAP
jgi:hypothetical protein